MKAVLILLACLVIGIGCIGLDREIKKSKKSISINKATKSTDRSNDSKRERRYKKVKKNKKNKKSKKNKKNKRGDEHNSHLRLYNCIYEKTDERKHLDNSVLMILKRSE